MGSGFSLKYNPEVIPNPEKETAFSPSLGFAGDRKERGEAFQVFSLVHRFYFGFICLSILVMIATEEEMISAKLQLDERDYCAHKLIAYKACRADVWPWAYKCAWEKHDYLNCQYDE